MKLSTRSRYGARMLLDIAQHGGEGPVCISDISKRQGVSVKYLEKLIRPLKSANYITSRRGPKGGHMLTKPAEQITVGEVVRLMEGEMFLTECADRPDLCEISADCLTRNIWIEATQAMYDKLDSVTFADLLKESKRGASASLKCVPTDGRVQQAKAS